MSGRLLHLYLRALTTRDPHLYYELGEAFCTGEVRGRRVVVAKARAARWYRRAASRGDRDAQCELGFMMLLGEGIPHRPAVGVQLMTDAAAHGYAEPMRVLVDCFGVGKFGLAVDTERAAYWRSRLDAHLARHPEDRRDHETVSDSAETKF